MRFVKTLVLFALGALALLAFTGASASATVLCSTVSTPCTAKWPLNTVLDFKETAMTQAELVDTNGKQVVKCGESTLKGAITKTGSGTETVTIKSPELLWGSCSVQFVTVTIGALEVHSIAGSNNGTLTTTEVELEVGNPFVGECHFGTMGGVTLGTLTAGSPATLSVNVVLKRTDNNGVCPLSAKFTASYTLAEPGGTTLDVEPS